MQIRAAATLHLLKNSRGRPNHRRLRKEIALILSMMRLHDHTDLTNPANLANWINARLDQGLNVSDHADIYGDTECERIFGEALAADPSLRQKVRIITKIGIVHGHQDESRWKTKHYRAEAGYISNAIDRALTRLQVEQIDTFLIHRPDPLMQAAAYWPMLCRRNC